MFFYSMFFCVFSASFFACKKKNVATDPKDIITEGALKPNSPESDLRLISVDPDSVLVGVRTPARAMGMGFQEGAVLYIDDTPISGVELMDESVLSFSIPALGQGSHDLKVENPTGETHTLLSAILAEPEEEKLPPECKEIVFYFAMDEYKLNPDAQALLDERKDCFSMDYQYRIEGHCDERGTTEYNISLGLKRAEILQKYLETQGVGNRRIETVSYGEERPNEQGDSEDSWSKNRRAVIWVID